jgi:hypothetical protein
MELTIQFLKAIQKQTCCHNSKWRNEKLEIKKIDDIDVDVRLLYNVEKKNYELKIWTDDEKDIRSNVLFHKQYSVLSKRYTITKFASELKEDFTKIRFSKLEDKFYTEPFVENAITLATNFLCSDNSLILVPTSINECGICFEQTKRKIDCCKNIVCYPCQLKITRKPFYHEEFECYEATPCPFCRRVIDTDFKFDEDEDEEVDYEDDEDEDDN